MSASPKTKLTLFDIKIAIESGANALVHTIRTVQTNASKMDFEFAINDAYLEYTRAVFDKVTQSDVIDPTVIVSAGAAGKPALIHSLKQSIETAAAKLDAAHKALEAKAKTTAELIATLEAVIHKVRDTKTDLETKH